jgi:hypothetical protein
MANNTVGELIIVNSLPTQQELINQSITVGGVTKTFQFPVIFRVIDADTNISSDFSYLDANTSYPMNLSESSISKWRMDEAPYKEGDLVFNDNSFWRSKVNNNTVEPINVWIPSSITNKLSSLTSVYGEES